MAIFKDLFREVEFNPATGSALLTAAMEDRPDYGAFFDKGDAEVVGLVVAVESVLYDLTFNGVKVNRHALNFVQAETAIRLAALNFGRVLVMEIWKA